METKVSGLKNRLFGSGGNVSGIFGGIGSVPNVCHSLCMSIVSLIATFGVTVSILPLMFLQTYQMYFWGTALIFTAGSLYFYLQQETKVARDRNLLLINLGLLTFGLPFSQLADYMDFFRFIGISSVATGLFLIFFAKKLGNIIYAQEQLQDVALNNTSLKLEKNEIIAPMVTTIRLPKLNISSMFFALIIVAFLINQYYMYRMGVFSKTPPSSSIAKTTQSISKMKMTAFDIALAKERMDKNNDGICDICGMPMQQCIDSGQMDCNMGNNSVGAIGILGSQHVHADLKVYANGQALRFDKQAYYMKSSFMHVDANANNAEDSSAVLHMHATKVPLGIFLRSIGMQLTQSSLTLDNGQTLANINGNSLKFYLNGKKVDELGDYAFQPLDKLLISYGPANDPDIQRQINSVTDFAKNH